MHLFGLCMSGIYLSNRESLKCILEEEVVREEVLFKESYKNYDHVISKI